MYHAVENTEVVIWNYGDHCTKTEVFPWWRSLLYRNRSIDLESKSMDWFLYLKNLHHKRVNGKLHFLCCYFKTFSSILEFSARYGNPEAYLKPFQTSKTVCFAKIVKPLTIFAKRSMLDVWQCSEYASGIVPNIYRLNPSYFHKVFSAKVSREIIKNPPKEAYITDAIFVILQAISL